MRPRVALGQTRTSAAHKVKPPINGSYALCALSKPQGFQPTSPRPCHPREGRGVPPYSDTLQGTKMDSGLRRNDRVVGWRGSAGADEDVCRPHRRQPERSRRAT